MNQRVYLLGVDGGGTSTDACLGVVDLDRPDEVDIVARASGGPSNPQVAGFEAAGQCIRSTCDQLFRQLDLPTKTVEFACFCLAGLGRPADRQRMSQWTEQAQLAQRWCLAADVEAVLASVQPWTEEGISVIAGTGSIAWGRKQAGDRAATEHSSVRSGGWGYLLGDEGSGFAIGKAALQYLTHMADGRAPIDSLAAALLDHLRLQDASELVDWCYGQPEPRPRIAALAPIVFAQQQMSAVADTIVREAAHELAQLVVSVAQRLGFQDQAYRLAGAGSVLCRQSDFQQLLESELRQLKCGPRDFQIVQQPVDGALRIAHHHWQALGQ